MGGIGGRDRTAVEPYPRDVSNRLGAVLNDMNAPTSVSGLPSRPVAVEGGHDGPLSSVSFRSHSPSANANANGSAAIRKHLLILRLTFPAPSIASEGMKVP